MCLSPPPSCSFQSNTRTPFCSFFIRHAHRDGVGHTRDHTNTYLAVELLSCGGLHATPAPQGKENVPGKEREREGSFFFATIVTTFRIPRNGCVKCVKLNGALVQDPQLLDLSEQDQVYRSPWCLPGPSSAYPQQKTFLPNGKRSGPYKNKSKNYAPCSRGATPGWRRWPWRPTPRGGARGRKFSSCFWGIRCYGCLWMLDGKNSLF